VSEPRARRRGGVIEATVFALVGVAILIGLGIWQLDRKIWKESLIATVTARLERAPADLPTAANWQRLTAATDEYARVTFPAELLAGQEALVYTAGSAFRPDVQGAGYWVFAPARLPGGSIVLVDRGFVPADRKDPTTRAQGAPQGVVDIVGVMRWPEARGMFTPADEPQNNLWYLRDSTAIAAAKKWDTAAPFYIEQEAPVPPGGLPKPGKLAVALPDNHLQYAITWFGLALGLTGVYLIYHARLGRLGLG
jgi:surfeit locus 1 family protein